MSFPETALSESPFYITGIMRTDAERLDDCNWKLASQINLTTVDGQPLIEKSSIKCMWNDKGLFFQFSAIGRDYPEKYVYSDYLWSNDYMEIWIDPGRSKNNFFQFSVDCFGQTHFGSFGDEKSSSAKMPNWQSVARKMSDGWKCEVFIPFKMLGMSPKVGDIWGINIGRENNRVNELTSWVDLDNFQQPDKFGKIIFYDKDYLNVADICMLEVQLAKRIYDAAPVLAQINSTLAVTSKLELSTFAKQQMAETVADYHELQQSCEDAKSFLEYHGQYVKAKELLQTVESFGRNQSLFGSETEGQLKGYVVCVENSMTKVIGKEYSASNLKNIDLELASNEYGAKQLTIIAKPGEKIDKLSVEMSNLCDDFGNCIAAENFQAYFVEEILTAIPRIIQKNIPDVLYSCTDFIVTKARELQSLWLDFYIPANTPAGTYKGTITVKPEKLEPQNIECKITVYPFTLPKQSSLKNVFCFVPRRTEHFYGKSMPTEKRLAYFDFMLAHRLEPVNLWTKGTPLMNEEELRHCIKNGKNLILIPIAETEEKLNSYLPDYLKMLEKNGWMDKAMFFGFDEILLHPKDLEQMQKMYAKVKEIAPGIPRLCTSEIDERLYGDVDVWCPLFNKYNSTKAQTRINQGEQVWWYPTDYPLKPYANFNLDSPGIDPRIIPWMNWKLNISGLLYWGVNREWVTNTDQQKLITENEKNSRNLNWLSDEILGKVDSGVRWPEIPWLPVFISFHTHKASPTNGGGNLMYPGPDWKPLPSIRLKNLRDGLQDYEYMTMLKNNVAKLKEHKPSSSLIARVESALKLNDKVVYNQTDYTFNGQALLNEKQHLADLITETQKELDK